MELNTTILVFIWIITTMLNCVVSSTFGHLPRRLLPPRFHSTPTNVTYEKGSLAILYCSIDNLGTKTVTWRKHPYNVPITVGTEQFVKINRFYLSANNVQWNLLIKNVQTFDAGTYECQISSTTKILRRNITLNVIETGKSFKQEIEITGTRVVEKGASIFLMCNASGITSPPDGIDWFKDGDVNSGKLAIMVSALGESCMTGNVCDKIITGIDKCIMSFCGNLLTTRQWEDTRIDKQISYSANVIVSTLTIRNTKMSDTGTYVCRTSELLTDTFQVNVLNAETNNVKREYEELSHGDDSQYGGLYYGRSCSYISSTSRVTLLFYYVLIHTCLYLVNR